MSASSKGMKLVELDPTGHAVAKAVRWHRQRLDLSFAELERRTDDIGHRIPVLGLRRIEAKARRVDVDDLTTLAAAFNVPVWKLLLPGLPDDPMPEGGQRVTGLVDVREWDEIRAWLRGETGLDLAEREIYWLRMVGMFQGALDRDESEIRMLRDSPAEFGDDDAHDRLETMEKFYAENARKLAGAKAQLEAIQKEMSHESSEG